MFDCDLAKSQPILEEEMKRRGVETYSCDIVAMNDESGSHGVLRIEIPGIVGTDLKWFQVAFVLGYLRVEPKATLDEFVYLLKRSKKLMDE